LTRQFLDESVDMVKIDGKLADRLLQRVIDLGGVNVIVFVDDAIAEPAEQAI
jgi:hypothetical protein